MDQNGHLRLTDFGLSKAVGNGRSRSFVGTPEYLAPEIVNHRGHGAEVDYWALGVMLVEMVAGLVRTPFTAKDDTKIYKNIMNEQPVLPKTSPELEQLLTGLLSKTVSNRIGSV